MLNRIIEWSLKNQFLVGVAVLFGILGGVWAIRTSRIDAIPDLSDVQVIIYTEYPGQGPQVVEDQVTFPIESKMLAVPYAKVVRGYSFFGYSFVYVIFEDGTDLYWARSRVLEYLSGLTSQLPRGVAPQLGPDATGVGWAFMYVLNSPSRSLADLRSLQDWYLKYGLTSVDGVSEVASIGGFVRQYQVEVDPVKLRAYDMPLSRIKTAIQRSNNDVGGRIVEMGEHEFMVRGLGYVKDVGDLRKVPLGVGSGGTPVLLGDVAHVGIGPEIRRGLADWNGEGETVGGIIVVRAGADTLSTIAGVKRRLAELRAGPPEGRDPLRRLRPDRADQPIRRNAHPHADRRVGHRGSRLPPVSLPLPLGVRRDFLDPPRDPPGLHRDAHPGPGRQHHVARRHRDLHRRAGRRRDHHGGERPQALRGVGRQALPLRDHSPLRAGGGPDALLQPARHHRVLHAGVHAAGAGGAPVQATRVHQVLFGRHGLARRRDRDPGSHVLARSRAHPQREDPSGFTPAAPALHAGPQHRAPSPVSRHGPRRSPDRGYVDSPPKDRIRVHAPALGGGPPLHADDLPGCLDHQRQAAPAAGGQDPPDVSRKSSPCSARSAAPRPRPTRLRCR